MITIFYFAEDFANEIDELAKINTEYKILLLDIHKKIVANSARQVGIRNENEPKIMDCHYKLINGINAINIKAAIVMKKILGI